MANDDYTAFLKWFNNSPYVNYGILIYDIETHTFGKADSEKDILKFFGCFSYKTNKFYLLRDKQSIQKIIDNHKFLVGFNCKGYDNPIMERFGINLKYKTIIDLFTVFDSRSTIIKIKEGLLEDLLMHKSLDFISKLIGVADKETGKKKINYDIFKKDSWTEQEIQEIKDYTERDIMVTKRMYEWVEEYFKGLKDYISKEDYEKKVHVYIDPAVLAYKAICYAMNWEATSNFEASPEEKIKGGYVAYPSGEQYDDDVVSFDFDSLYPNIMNQANIYGRKKPGDVNDRPTWNGGGVWKIEGIYYADEMSPVSKLIRKWFEERLEFKKNNDPRQNSIKIILNIIYGIMKNPKFVKTCDVIGAGDVTRLGRQFIQYARKEFNKAGYELIYSDTDSIYVFDPFKDKERLCKVRDNIINYIRSTLPFPYENFGMKLENEIKHIYFFKGQGEKETETEDFMSDEFDFFNKPKNLMKKNYIYVTKDDKLTIKNLGIKKKSNSQLSRKIFWDDLVPQIKKGQIKFSKIYISKLINKYLSEDISLACLRYNVGSIAQYEKSPTGIYAQIAGRHGPGLHFLIPNNKVGVGKKKFYCTVEEFKKNNMTQADIILDNVWSELNYFIKPVVVKNIFDF